ncbi:ABC transporter permease [Pseudokineococcus sp. 1T1Z-3]|uniref:ABC transporter permease n=1 Tax=Pseudokineococcus sp. 1T1Z-3 TaxID=3132745 RepID=UPI0030ABDFE7
MRLLAAHSKVEVLGHLREPLFVVPVLIFPLLFVLSYGISLGTSAPAANDVLLNAACFGALGVALLVFGAGTATERGTPWERTLRTLAVTVRTRVLAKLVSASLVLLASLVVVTTVGFLATAAAFTPASLAAWVAAALVGAVPLVVLGLAIGYWSGPRAAVPAVLVLFSALTFTSGMAGPVDELPGAMSTLAPYLPATSYVDVVKAAAQLSFPLLPWVTLAGFTALFGAVAAAGYRRTEHHGFG